MSLIADDQPSKEGIQSLREALRLGLAVVSEVWSHSTDDWVTSVHAADIDGDGDIEVLVGSREGSVRVLTRKGIVKWQFEERSDWFGTVFGVNTAESITGARVIVGSRDNKVYAFNETGQKLWSYTAEQVVRRVRAYDIDHDGNVEVVFGSEDWSVYVLSSIDGTLLWRYRTNGWVRAVFSADIDGDGEIETLAASGDKHLYVLDSKGQLKQKYNVESKIHAIYAVDLDRDGIVEILIASDAKDIYALTPDRQKKWSFSPENRIHSISVEDFNKDGYLEVIAGSEDEHIYFLDHQGRLLWKHFLGSRIFSIFAIDLDRDGILEILVGSDDDNVHLLRVELTEGLLSKIHACHQAINHYSPELLPLSPTECTLLQDLAETKSTPSPTTTQVEQAFAAHDYLQALSTLVKLEQQRVEVLWQIEVKGIRSLRLGSIADAGTLDMVIGTDMGEVQAFNIRGERLWTFPWHDRIRSVRLGDIDGDGELEVVVGTLDGHVCALDRDGKTIKWNYTVDDAIQSISIVPPTSQQDYTEVTLGSENKRIYIYGRDYLPVTEPIITPEGINTVITYDLNKDGIQEIIAGGIDNNVYAYTREGELQWTYPTRDRIKVLHVTDIDDDGRVEIIIGSEDRYVYVLNDQGALKWRYHARHRVMDIDAVDIDGDGQIEVLVGVGDGFVYVLNGSGDLLWRYQANDRVRVVRAADIDNDGVVEIVVGSEDRLYLLRVIDRRQHQQYLAQSRQALLTGRSHQELIYTLSLEADPHLRSFALMELATYPELTEHDFERFRPLLTDPSHEVRTRLAKVIASIYQANPSCARDYLDLLSSDLSNDVRLAFINSLPSLTQQDPQVGFKYLDRFTRNIKKLIRRTIVRELDQLTPMFEQQVFELLLNTIGDKKAEWIRQESARVLAHYFDVHTHMLVTGTRLLMTKGVDCSLCELIMRCAKVPVVQNIFSALAGLLSDLTADTILARLKGAVEALEQTRALTNGESMWAMHYEFYRLHCMCTIDEIAGYRCSLKMMPTGDETHFTDTLQVLHGLNEPVTVLKTYLRREGLGDRLASLLEATHAIEALMADIEECSYFKWCGQQQFPDLSILRLLLTRWHAIVLAEIARLRGKAELRAELQTQRVRQETQVTVWLRIHNGGRSPADNVMVTLMPSDAFIVVGVSKQQFVTISTRDAVRVEFTVRPLKPSLRLCFEIVYDDAEHRGKEMQFADLLELVVMEQEFRPIPNPYIAGQPIRDSNMFYGRDEELKFLQENLTRLSTNTVIVLYGQRRSGKSSLLYQLRNTSLLSPHVPVYIDMQGLMLSNSTSRLLFKVARTIHQDLQEQGVIVVPPQLAPFEEDATFALDIFLDEVQDRLKRRNLVLLIDEFEMLEEQVRQGRVDKEIFDYLRSLMQHRRGIHFLLAGTHTLEQFTSGYWSVFFNIARHSRLSKLSEEAAHKLITSPVEGSITYDPFAIEKIHHLTGDQPYLIQLICNVLVEHCNSCRKSYVTINDVNVVQEEVMETGHILLNWIREQSTTDERVVLSAVAQESGDDGHYVSLTDIEAIYRDNGLPYRKKEVLQVLHHLKQRDIIDISEGTRFRIPVGLTCRWLREAKPLQQVMLEENLLPS